MPQLRYLDNAGQLTTFELSAGKITIGRGEACQVILEGDLISREHTQIEREVDGRWRVRDLGSRNKTYLNGLQISDALLSGGDILRIGGRLLEFRDGPTRLQTTLQELLTDDRKDPPGVEYVKIRDAVPLQMGQIEKLSDLTFQTSMIPRVEDLADAVLTRLLMELQAERGFIAMKGAERGAFDVLTARALGRLAGGNGTALSQNFVYAGLSQGLGGRYPNNPKLIDTQEGLPATAVIAPLVSSGKPIGVIYLDRPLAKRPFDASALHFLLAAGATLGSTLTQSHRRMGALYRQSAAANLAVLRRMQADITPNIALGEAYTYSGRVLHGHERCGDLRDFVAVEDKLLAITLDAGGTGTSGFVQGASIMTALRAVVQRDPDHIDLESTFNSINRTVAVRKGRQLVACSTVLVDPSRSAITYINAGMPPPILLIAPGRTVPMDRSNLLLGVDPEHIYEQTTIELPDAYRLVLHSDGLTEAVNLDGKLFGEQALIDVVVDRQSYASPAAIVEGAFRQLAGHMDKKPLEDDASLHVVSHG